MMSEPQVFRWSLCFVRACSFRLLWFRSTQATRQWRVLVVCDWRHIRVPTKVWLRELVDLSWRNILQHVMLNAGLFASVFYTHVQVHTRAHVAHYTTLILHWILPQNSCMLLNTCIFLKVELQRAICWHAPPAEWSWRLWRSSTMSRRHCSGTRPQTARPTRPSPRSQPVSTWHRRCPTRLDVIVYIQLQHFYKCLINCRPFGRYPPFS